MFQMILPDLEADRPLLIERRRGETNAVVVVYERYFPPLYQYVRLRVGDPLLAQDIVSEVSVHLVETLGKRAAPRENLRAWLFQVARHEIYRTYGKVIPLPLDDVADWMPAAPESNPAESLESEGFDLDRVRHALRMLAPEHQEVLILRFGQRLSVKETADIMGKSGSAVKSLLFRALETLRAILIEPEVTNG